MTDFYNQRAAFRFYEAYITLAALAELYPEAAKSAAAFIRLRCAEQQDDEASKAFQDATVAFLMAEGED